MIRTHHIVETRRPERETWPWVYEGKPPVDRPAFPIKAAIIGMLIIIGFWTAFATITRPALKALDHVAWEAAR